MTQKSEIGKLGENLACKYLKDKGYWIIERNFRKPWGEIDIIARQKDGTLVFVEVKALQVSSLRLSSRNKIYENSEHKIDAPRQSSGNKVEISRLSSGYKVYEDWQELTPEEHLTHDKLKKLRRTASLYAGHKQELIKDKRGWRIDLVAINLPIVDEFLSLTNLIKSCDIKHYENL